MTLGELQKIFREKLKALYDLREANAITKLVFEKNLNVNSLKIALEKFRLLTTNQLEQMNEVLERLLRREPVQYVLGESYFFGLMFKVNTDVLIPRPETEELVEWVIEDYRDAAGPLSVLDIGTGTGCIAIALAKHLKTAQVTGLDVSEEALKIAAENNELNKTSARFLEADILEDEIPDGPYDIIVSNPPYVLDSERDTLAYHVINFEPHLALFAPVDEPLRFYRVIAVKSAKALKEGGKLYFEVHAERGKEVATLMESAGFKNVAVKEDLSGKDRMVSGVIMKAA